MKTTDEEIERRLQAWPRGARASLAEWGTPQSTRQPPVKREILNEWRVEI
jgi:hypothetical protein